MIAVSMSERSFSHRNGPFSSGLSQRETSPHLPSEDHRLYRTASPATRAYSRNIERALFPEKGLADDDAWRGEEDPVFAPWKPAPSMPAYDDPDWSHLTDKWWKARDGQVKQERTSWERGEGPPVPSRPSFSYATRHGLRWQREHIENDQMELELRQEELNRMKRSLGEGVVPAERVLWEEHERPLRNMEPDVRRRNREELILDEARPYYAPPSSAKQQPYSGADHLPRIPLHNPREKLEDLERELHEMASRVSLRREASVEGAINPGHRRSPKVSKALRYDWERRKHDRDDEAYTRIEDAWMATQPAHGPQDYDRQHWLEQDFYQSRGYLRYPENRAHTLHEDERWVLPEKRPGEDRPHGRRPAQKPYRLVDDARRAAEARRDRLSDDLRKEEEL